MATSRGPVCKTLHRAHSGGNASRDSYVNSWLNVERPCQYSVFQFWLITNIIFFTFIISTESATILQMFQSIYIAIFRIVKWKNAYEVHVCTMWIIKLHSWFTCIYILYTFLQIDGCTKVSVNSSEIELNSRKYSIWGELMINASVTEAGTGITWLKVVNHVIWCYCHEIMWS